MNIYDLLIRRSRQSDESDSSSSGGVSNVIRFAAGVDTTLYLTNTNGVFVATPSGSWGGTGYHEGIKDTWVSFYPKHGLKYSLNGGSTYLDWCFEDTNSTLDLSAIVGTTILSVTKISGRDTVSLSGQQITVADPSAGSRIYEFDVEMEAPDSSDSSSSGGITPILPTDEAKAYLLASNLKDAKHSGSDYDLSAPNGGVSYQTVDSRACTSLNVGCAYNTFVNGNKSNGCALSIWTKFKTVPASSATAKGFANGSLTESYGIWLGYRNGVYIGGGGDKSLNVVTSTVPCDTAWHNLCINYDATTLKIDLWVDGTKQGTVTIASALASSKGSVINALTGSNSQTPEGYNDTITYYSNYKYFARTLTDADIRGLAQE